MSTEGFAGISIKSAEVSCEVFNFPKDNRKTPGKRSRPLLQLLALQGWAYLPVTDIEDAYQFGAGRANKLAGKPWAERSALVTQFDEEDVDAVLDVLRSESGDVPAYNEENLRRLDATLQARREAHNRSDLRGL